MDFIATVVISTCIALLVKWIWDRRNIQQTWQRLGIPGPKSSSLLFGNLKEVLDAGTYPIYEKWKKTYGKVFGYYQTCTPVLVTSDPDIAREIFIKQFEKFQERWLFIDNTKYPIGNLVDMGGEQWKKVRGLSSPTFNAKRMKQMSPLVHKSIDKLMARFKERAEKGEAFDIAYDVKRLTLDVIASTVFSYDTDVFNEDDNIFLLKMIDMFKKLDPKQAPLYSKLRTILVLMFPGLVTFLRYFNPWALGPENTWFTDLAKRMIQDRLDTGEYRADYIQLMLSHKNKNVSGNTSGTDTESDLSDNEQRSTARDIRRGAKRKELTMEEMQGQIFVFLAAGYETTATTLGYMSYYLALYPDIQRKLQDEIDKYFPDLGKPVNYETVQNLPYLDMVFCETSRLASIAQIVTSRMCSEDTDVCGYHIPKGAKVVVNMLAIHSDPELWGPEPVDQFVPERFTKERKGNRHPMAYMPFGGGPRNCIGMRFAIMEAKMEVINMLKRFTILKCAETQVPLKCTRDGIHGPAEGVYVKLIKRE